MHGAKQIIFNDDINNMWTVNLVLINAIFSRNFTKGLACGQCKQHIYRTCQDLIKVLWNLRSSVQTQQSAPKLETTYIAEVYWYDFYTECILRIHYNNCLCILYSITLKWFRNVKEDHCIGMKHQWDHVLKYLAA